MVAWQFAIEAGSSKLCGLALDSPSHSKQHLRSRAIPAADSGIHNELQVRQKSGPCHVFRVQLEFGRENDRVVIVIQPMVRQRSEYLLFAGKGDRGRAGNPGRQRGLPS